MLHWELCFWGALTPNPACGAALSRACRWTQTPCALPLKPDCVISPRSTRSLWIHLSMSTQFHITFHCLDLTSDHDFPECTFIFAWECMISPRRLDHKKPPTSVRPGLTIFILWFLFLMGALWNLRGYFGAAHFSRRIHNTTNWKQRPAFHLRSCESHFADSVRKCMCMPTALRFVVSESEPNNRGSTCSDDCELHRTWRIRR